MQVEFGQQQQLETAILLYTKRVTGHANVACVQVGAQASIVLACLTIKLQLSRGQKFSH